MFLSIYNFLSLFSFIYFHQVSLHEGTRMGVAFKFTTLQYSSKWQTNSTWRREIWRHTACYSLESSNNLHSTVKVSDVPTW